MPVDPIVVQVACRCELRRSSGEQRRRKRRMRMAKTTLVTGGSGYIGALLARELQDSGRDVRVLDRLLHGQEDIAAEQTAAGVLLVRGDVRDESARGQALAGVQE